MYTKESDSGGTLKPPEIVPGAGTEDDASRPAFYNF